MTLYMLAITIALSMVLVYGEVIKYDMAEDFCGRDVPFDKAIPLSDISVTDTTVIHVPAMSQKSNCWVIVNGGVSDRAMVTTHPVNATCPHVMYKTRAADGSDFRPLCDVAHSDLITGHSFPLVVDYTQTSQREPFDIIMVPVHYAFLGCQEKKGFNDSTCCVYTHNDRQIGQDDSICDRIVCINAAYICDGYVSCEDGRDEGELCEELKAQREAEERARAAADGNVFVGNVLAIILCGILCICVNALDLPCFIGTSLDNDRVTVRY